MDLLETGDLLLFETKVSLFNPMTWFAGLIEMESTIPYSHCGIFLRDPSFIHPALKGDYIWESAYEDRPDPQDGKVKLGVRITPMSEYLMGYKGWISARKLLYNESKVILPNEILKKIHDTVYDKPYDIRLEDWLKEGLHVEFPRTTDCFWCSAFVGYFYTTIGAVDRETDWSILKPCDFILEDDKNCKWSSNYRLGNNIHLN